WGITFNHVIGHTAIEGIAEGIDSGVPIITATSPVGRTVWSRRWLSNSAGDAIPDWSGVAQYMSMARLGHHLQPCDWTYSNRGYSGGNRLWGANNYRYLSITYPYLYPSLHTYPQPFSCGMQFFCIQKEKDSK
ncbi:hypothetical protein CAPTEDRAFT_185682, partial [Capitella teleta]